MYGPRSANLPRRDEFEYLRLWLKKGRKDPESGRIFQNATVVRCVGPVSAPSKIIVRHHWTDILIFHSDGSFEVSTNSLCTSDTTRSRFDAYAGISISYLKLPTVNGYSTNPGKAMFLNTGNRWEYEKGNMYAFRGVDGYITIRKDRTVDEDTVKPHVVDAVSNPTELRRAMRHLGKVAKLFLGYAKLKGGDSTEYFQNGRLYDLSSYVGVPLTDVDFSNPPHLYLHGKSIKEKILECVTNSRWEIARRHGWLTDHSVKIL